MRSCFSPATHFHCVRVLILAFSMVLVTGIVFATDVVENLTGYDVTEFQPAPAGDSLVSFDWDATGALYYMTGDPNWGLELNVYRNVGGAETAVYQSTAVFPGSRITTVGSHVYFNDGGDYGRYTFNYYAYDIALGGAPVLSYDSAAEPLSLWGIDTRDGSQFFASGAVGFGASSIYYMPAPANGLLAGLVSLGEIGESSGPVAFDTAGNLFYAHGYVSGGQAKIYRWTASELAAAVANPLLAPLTPANHEWAALPATFTGAGGMTVDAAGNVYVTANAWGAPGELLQYRPASPVPTILARHANRLETLRLRESKLYVNCAAGIYRMSVPLSVSLAGEAQVQAVAGKPLSLSVLTSGGEGPLSYAWFLTGFGKADISLGNNAPTLTVSPALQDSGKGYYCMVTDAAGTVTSPTYTLAVVVGTSAASFLSLALLAMGLAVLGLAAGRQRERTTQRNA